MGRELSRFMPRANNESRPRLQGDGSDECPVAQVAGLEVAEVKRSVVVADGVDCEGVALGEEVRLWGWAL